MTDSRSFEKLISWTISYKCNYRCPYCFVWRDESEKDLILNPEQWIEIWKKIYDRYGKCMIHISGGEPSVYPGFFELIKELTGYHECMVCTNFSWDPHIVIPEIKSEDFKIFATFHPGIIPFDRFYENIRYAKDYIENNTVAYVAYEKQIKDIPFYRNELKKIGIDLLVHPLRDEGFEVKENKVVNTETSKGQKLLNTEEEKIFIKDNTAELNEYRLGIKSPKGKMCVSGKDYICIWPDGTVNRCTRCRDEIMGNIIDMNFEFFEEPKICSKDLCPIEYRMIQE